MKNPINNIIWKLDKGKEKKETPVRTESFRTLERFWSRVRRRGKHVCWDWTGGTHDRRAGKFYIRGGKWALAHHFSYQIHYGNFPKNCQIVLRCGNRFCVNPGHMCLRPRKIGRSILLKEGEK